MHACFLFLTWRFCWGVLPRKVRAIRSYRMTYFTFFFLKDASIKLQSKYSRTRDGWGSPDTWDTRNTHETRTVFVLPWNILPLSPKNPKVALHNACSHVPATFVLAGGMHSARFNHFKCICPHQGNPLSRLQHVGLGWQLLANVFLEDLPQFIITIITRFVWLNRSGFCCCCVAVWGGWYVPSDDGVSCCVINCPSEAAALLRPTLPPHSSQHNAIPAVAVTTIHLSCQCRPSLPLPSPGPPASRACSTCAPRGCPCAPRSCTGCRASARRPCQRSSR